MSMNIALICYGRRESWSRTRVRPSHAAELTDRLTSIHTHVHTYGQLGGHLDLCEETQTQGEHGDTVQKDFGQPAGLNPEPSFCSVAPPRLNTSFM